MTPRTLAYAVSRSSRVRALAVLALAVLPAACDGPSGPGDPNQPAAVEIVSGDGQEGPVSTLLPRPLVVRVTNARGQPVRGTEVQWSVRLGGGSTSAISSMTDDAGEASIRWTLGPAEGSQAADGGPLGVRFVTFQATASPAP